VSTPITVVHEDSIAEDKFKVPDVPSAGTMSLTQKTEQNFG